MLENAFQWGATAWSLELFAPHDTAAFRRTAETISKLPFPAPASVIEVFASMGGPEHARSLAAAGEQKRIAKDLGMRIIGCGFNPHFLDKEGEKPSPHLTSSDATERASALARVCAGVHHVAELAEPGQGILSGPWHTRHAHLYQLREGELDSLVDILREQVVPYAEALGVITAFEPLRAHEQCLVMPGDEALDIVSRVNSSYAGLNGDTVHWASAAEGNLTGSLAKLAKSGYLIDLHLSEHDRRQWGRGDIGARTKEILQAVHGAGYRGPVVLENFCDELHPLLHIHRPLIKDNGFAKTPYEVLRDGAGAISTYLSDAFPS